MKNSVLRICNEVIHPGEQLTLALPLPEIFSCAPLYMPIKIIHGKQAGPCLLVTAAMHGNELNGTEIINRLLAMSLVNRLSGTLICIPVVNVYGLINRSRNLPNGLTLDNAFPGSQTGSHAARLADTFCQEIFAKADVCIDLQTGHLNYSNLPQVYVNSELEQENTLAKAFNAPVIAHAKTSPGSLRSVAAAKDVPFLLYEAGEAMRFDEYAIKTGVKGIINVMRQLGLLASKSPKKSPEFKSFFAEENVWVRAASSGITHTKLKLGHHVKAGDELCRISDPFGASDSVIVTSPNEGILVGMNNSPLVHEGETLYQLAVFAKMAHAASQLEEWEEANTDASTTTTAAS